MIKTCAGLVLAATLPSLAAAEEYWGSNGPWDIYAEPGVGCYIERNFDDGGMRIGLDVTGDTGFFAVISPNFDDVVDGYTYDVEFFLDGEGYDGSAEAFEIDGIYGYHLEITNVDFVYDLAARYRLAMFDEGVQVVDIDLNGSDSALGAAADCTDTM